MFTETDFFVNLFSLFYGSPNIFLVGFINCWLRIRYLDRDWQDIYEREWTETAMITLMRNEENDNKGR